MAGKLLLAAALLVAAAGLGEAAEVTHTAALRGAEVLPADAPEDEHSYSNLTNIFTPPNATHPLDALNAFHDMLSRELRSEQYQWLVTLITGVLGFTMVLSPNGSFQYVFLAMVFAVTYTMAMAYIQDNHSHEHPEDHSGLQSWEIILALEIALGVSLVARKGFQGVELCIAMSLGVYPLRLLQACFSNSGLFGASAWWNVVVFTVSAGFGLFLVRNHRLELILNYILPVVGGRLTSASVGWFVFNRFHETSSRAWLDFWHSLPLDFNDRSTPDMWQAVQGAPEVGWSTPTDGSRPEWVGVALGSGIWFVLTLVSICCHHRSVALQKRAEKQTRDHAHSVDEASKVLLDHSHE